MTVISKGRGVLHLVRMSKRHPGLASGDAEFARRGRIAVDHRASLAHVWFRRDRGDNPDLCPDCKCEVDVPEPAHSWRCVHREERKAA